MKSNKRCGIQRSSSQTKPKFKALFQKRKIHNAEVKMLLNQIRNIIDSITFLLHCMFTEIRDHLSSQTSDYYLIPHKVSRGPSTNGFQLPLVLLTFICLLCGLWERIHKRGRPTLKRKEDRWSLLMTEKSWLYIHCYHTRFHVIVWAFSEGLTEDRLYLNTSFSPAPLARLTQTAPLQTTPLPRLTAQTPLTCLMRMEENKQMPRNRFHVFSTIAMFALYFHTNGRETKIFLHWSGRKRRLYEF